MAESINSTVADSIITSEEQVCIRLPCSHLIPEPAARSIHLTCPAESCGRKWHVYRKGVEICAREEV